MGGGEAYRSLLGVGDLSGQRAAHKVDYVRRTIVTVRLRYRAS
jgi:hypothetical protein